MKRHNRHDAKRQRRRAATSTNFMDHFRAVLADLNWCGTYILGGRDGRTPVRAEMLEWGMWIARADRSPGIQGGVSRHVARTEIPGGGELSTVFIGINSNWGGGRPVLFETMVFGCDLDPENHLRERYCTWDEAQAGHERVYEELCRRSDAARDDAKTVVDEALGKYKKE